MNEYENLSSKEVQEEDLPELATVSMEVILEAGDARIAAQQACEKLRDFDFTAAEQLLETANEHLVKAHASQTDIIQAEASGRKYEPSFLFNHAQDTLMTVMSEYNLTKELVFLYKRLYFEIHPEKGGAQ